MSEEWVGVCVGGPLAGQTVASLGMKMTAMPRDWPSVRVGFEPPPHYSVTYRRMLVSGSGAGIRLWVSEELVDDKWFPELLRGYANYKLPGGE